MFTDARFPLLWERWDYGPFGKTERWIERNVNAVPRKEHGDEAGNHQKDDQDIDRLREAAQPGPVKGFFIRIESEVMWIRFRW